MLNTLRTGTFTWWSRVQNRSICMLCLGSSVVAGGAIALAMALPLAAQEVRDSSYRAPDGTRVLRQSISVPAGVLVVWQAFTTTDGVRSWAVPVADVDFRLGGIWESSYKRDARIGDPGNIRNRFLSFLPPRMFAMQAIQAPPSFPHADLLPEIFTVVEFEELGPSEVRVTVSMVGYKDGGGYDVLYRHFEAGNAWTLQQLRRRFEEGPKDWNAVAVPTGAGQ
jgi:uncharacterized protein YndB with AHSA1/START domain